MADSIEKKYTVEDLLPNNLGQLGNSTPSFVNTFTDGVGPNRMIEERAGDDSTGWKIINGSLVSFGAPVIGTKA